MIRGQVTINEKGIDRGVGDRWSLIYLTPNINRGVGDILVLILYPQPRRYRRERQVESTIMTSQQLKGKDLKDF